MSTSAALPTGTLYFPLLLLFSDGGPLVVFSLSLGKGQGDLCLAILEIDLKGYQGLALLSDLAYEALDLVPVKKKLPGPKGIVVFPGRMRILADVHVQEKQFPAPNAGIAVLQVGSSKPERLDLGAPQNHAGFVLIEYEVVVPGLSILAYNLYTGHKKLPERRLENTGVLYSKYLRLTALPATNINEHDLFPAGMKRIRPWK